LLALLHFKKEIEDMKIKNANLAGVTMAFKSGTVTGDENGVVDVPDEKEARTLAEQAGWGLAKSGKAVSEPTLPEPEPEPVEDDLGDEVDAAVDEVTLDDAAADDLDLDSMTKNQLLDLAADHGVEVEATWRKADIREAIEAALGGN
jgi:hypothetical protein